MRDDHPAQPAGFERGLPPHHEGDTSRVLQLVDRLSAELLVKRRPGPVFRLTQTAAVTTRSLPALKAFLDGERNLRNGKPDTAIAGFQRAITEGSTFSLASESELTCSLSQSSSGNDESLEARVVTRRVSLKQCAPGQRIR